MASTNRVNLVPVTVQLATAVPGALANRFVKFETSSANEREVITFVPGALTGGFPDGILAESINTTLADGFYSSSMAVPDGCYPKVLLGENVTKGALLRAGGYTSEVDGAAYLADATSDVQIGTAMEAGSAGEIIQIQFLYKGIHA